MLREWDWKEHFSAQPDTLRYLNHVADRFGLRPDMQFGSRVTTAHYDMGNGHWNLTLENGKRFRTRFLFTALGPLSACTMPAIPDVDSFRGDAFHIARWPHEPVSLEGKRVGIIGTGATAIQTIAKLVWHLTIFQRTPNWAAPLHNSEITEEEQCKIRQRVRDPRIADKLIPKDHGFGLRRVPMETHYQEFTFG